MRTTRFSVAGALVTFQFVDYWRFQRNDFSYFGVCMPVKLPTTLEIEIIAPENNIIDVHF